MKALPCIVCGKELQAVSDQRTQPYGGTGFWTYGHYGSTVFDLDPGFLALVVCDPCLTKAGERGDVVHGHTPRIRPETTYTDWPAA